LHPGSVFFWTTLSSVQEVKLLKKWIDLCEVDLKDGVARKVMGKRYLHRGIVAKNSGSTQNN
jgi:hypothetical protein